MRPRFAVAALSVSAAALVSLALDESYTSTAVVPVKGDVPTVGFGSTQREDGSAVQMGDTITPPKALARTLVHIQRDELGLKRCVRAPVSQLEYDLMVDFAYQYGVARLCESGIVAQTNAGQYRAACEVYAAYRKVNGRDCARTENWGPGGCKGVWLRAERRRETCLSGLQP